MKHHKSQTKKQRKLPVAKSPAPSKAGKTTAVALPDFHPLMHVEYRENT